MSGPASPATQLRRSPVWTLPRRLAPDVLPVAGLFLLAGATRFDAGRAPWIAAAILILPLLLRRLAPTAVLIVVTLWILVTAATTSNILTDVAAIALASYTMGERATARTRSLAITILAATLLMAGLLAQDAEPAKAVILPFAILLPSWLAGDIVRGRRMDARARGEAAERESREREAALRDAVGEERRRVARELHDVVAHSVSVMLIQAGAARQVLDTTPTEANAALLAVEQTGRETMAELRTLLGALGDGPEAGGGEGGGLAPQPGLDRVPELVARVHDAGLPVALEVTGEARRLPPAIDVTAYRIIQEALTNALRYAAGSRTLVELGYEPAQLRLEVLDSGPGMAGTSQGAGAGLAGLRDRAALAGGYLEAGPRLGGGWAVRAWLPVPTNPA